MPEKDKKKKRWFKAAHYIAQKGLYGSPMFPKKQSLGQMGAEARIKAERWRERKKKLWWELNK